MEEIFRTTNPPALHTFPEYLDAIADKFCPFLGPSLMRGLSFFTVYFLSDASMIELQKQIFYLGFLHTEILRARRLILSGTEKLLVNENLIFRFDSEDSVNGKEMLDWPHWALKLM